MCSTGHSKTFSYFKLLNVLRRMVIPEHLIVLMKDLYTAQLPTLRLDMENVNGFRLANELDRLSNNSRT